MLFILSQNNTVHIQFVHECRSVRSNLDPKQVHTDQEREINQRDKTDRRHVRDVDARRESHGRVGTVVPAGLVFLNATDGTSGRERLSLKGQQS